MRRALLFVATMLLAGMTRDGKPAGLFSSYDVLALRLEAPFDELFSRAKQEPDYTVAGTLMEPASGGEGKRLPVKISLRGHTSRRDTECTFPKLKVALGDAANDTDGSVLAGIKTLKIGTHCGEARDDTLTRRFGRLPNERSPHREAAVYRILDALDIPALRARPARITYVYTNASAAEAAAPSEPIERNAMLLEDEEAGIARLGGTREIAADEFTSADQLFTTADSAMLAFAQALAGNFDWCIRFTMRDTYRCDARMKLWNVIAMAVDGGKARPVMYDFDVSGMVTGSHRWFDNVYNPTFVPSKSHAEVEVLGQVQRTRSLFPRADLDATRQRFMARKAAAYQALDDATIDADGRAHIRAYMDAFYAAIESDDAFYRPVVVAEGTVPRAEPGGGPICTSRGAIPIGTPVSDPLESRDAMMRVVLLDALWHWAPPTRCAPIQTDAVWIEKSAVSRDYPKR